MLEVFVLDFSSVFDLSGGVTATVTLTVFFSIGRDAFLVTDLTLFPATTWAVTGDFTMFFFPGELDLTFLAIPLFLTAFPVDFTGAVFVFLAGTDILVVFTGVLLAFFTAATTVGDFGVFLLDFFTREAAFAATFTDVFTDFRGGAFDVLF